MILQYGIDRAKCTASAVAADYLMVVPLEEDDLHDRLHEQRWRPNPEQLVRLALQLADACAHIHCKGDPIAESLGSDASTANPGCRGHCMSPSQASGPTGLVVRCDGCAHHRHCAPGHQARQCAAGR